MPGDLWTAEDVELVATATEQHYIEDYETTDAMGHHPCVCGRWWDAAGDNPGWDQHMAEVALAALAEAGRLASQDQSAVEARVRTQVAAEIADEIERVIDGYPANGETRPKVETGLHANDAQWAAQIARQHVAGPSGTVGNPEGPA